MNLTSAGVIQLRSVSISLISEASGRNGSRIFVQKSILNQFYVKAVNRRFKERSNGRFPPPKLTTTHLRKANHETNQNMSSISQKLRLNIIKTIVMMNLNFCFGFMLCSFCIYFVMKRIQCPSPARNARGRYFRNFWVGMCRWYPGTFGLCQS